MAVESPINEEHEVFVGEHKVLRWTVRDGDGALVNVTTFTVRLGLYRRRNPLPVVVITASIVDAPGGVVAATLAAAQSIILGAGAHRYILERTDVGAEAVLAYGAIVLKERTT